MIKIAWTISVALALATGALPALAQTYPSKPVRVISHLPPGTPAEIPPRGMAEALGRAFGQAFVVENRPGADGFIASEACARAAPDGYTLCGLTQSQIVLNSFFHAKLPYDPERDFTPVGYLGTFTSALVVNTKLPVNSVREFIELAKSKPESLSWATLGGTSMGPLYTAWMKQNAGAIFYAVPFKSTLDGFRAVIAGDVSAVVIAVGPVIPQAKAGKVKVLAVTSAKRWADLPDVPTMKEEGFDMPLNFNPWLGIFGPAGLQPEVLRRLNSEMVKIMDDPGFKAKFITSNGLEADDYGRATPAEFAALIRNDREKIAKGMAEAGIKKQ